MRRKGPNERNPKLTQGRQEQTTSQAQQKSRRIKGWRGERVQQLTSSRPSRGGRGEAERSIAVPAKTAPFLVHLYAQNGGASFAKEN